MHTSQSHVKAHIVNMTPELAAELLAKNPHNRPLSKPYVRELRRELEEGRWKTTHQGVAVDEDGNVLDGQHRLTAIVESGITVEMLLAEGVARDAFGAIDQHRKRTGGQILAMSGVSRDAPRMIAMARAILQVVYGNSKVSNTAAAEYAVLHQLALERYLPVARQFTPAVAAAFAWVTTLGWNEAGPAADRLVTNGPWEEPQETDPMRALTNRSREFVKLGAGQAGIKARFDIALNCLQAIHEARGLRVARSYRPDYLALENELEVVRMRPTQPPTRVEYDGSEEPPNVLASETPPEMTDDHAAKLEATLVNNRRRKSFMSPADILGKLGAGE